MQWYYTENGKQQGPVELVQLIALAREGRLKPEDLVWNASMGSQWAAASSVTDLFPPPAPAAPPGVGAPMAAEANPEWSDTATFTSASANRDLMAHARTALDGHWGLAIGGLLIYGLIMVALASIPILGQVVGFVISGPLVVGLMLFSMKLSRQAPAEIGQLFEGFKQFGNAFVAFLLIMLLVLAWSLPALVVGIGVAAYVVVGAIKNHTPDIGLMLVLILLVIAAVIPAVIARYRYSQTYFILNDFPGVGPMAAIQRSTQMMAGNKWKLFCLQCRFIGWALLCIPTLGLGLLWLAPYMLVSMASFYDDVKASGQ